MATLKQILVPIDFGTNTAQVLDYGRTLADRCGASMHVLHVVCDPLDDVAARGARHDEAVARLHAMLDRQDRDVRQVVSACTFGTPAPEIARYAAEHGIDLIVMGTHSHGPTFQMLTGSIAEAVLGMAPCAVLAVKGDTTAAKASATDSRAALTSSP